MLSPLSLLPIAGMLLASLLGFIGARLKIAGIRRRASEFERLVAQVRRVKANGAHQGTVRLEGRAEVEERVLVSPVHAQECFAFLVEVQELEHHGDWVTLHRRREVLPFRVVDETGVVVVKADDSIKLELDREPDVTQLEHEPFPQWAAELVDALGIESRRGDRPRQLRLVEWRLDPGERCTVVGRIGAVVAGAGVGGYRVAASAAVLTADEGAPLVVADRSGDEVLRSLARQLMPFNFISTLTAFCALVMALILLFSLVTF